MYNLFYIALIFIFIGCGGGGGGGGSSSPSSSSSTTKSADFIDAPISGITYICSSSSTTGVTNDNGTFQYDNNCGDLTFSVGNVIIYTIDSLLIPADQKLYITDLVGVDRNDTNNSEVISISRFLQSLDDDGNPYDGITITTDVIVSLEDVSVDLNFVNNPFPTIDEINTTIESLGKTLISADDAKAHMTYTLNSDLSLDIDSPPPPAPILTITPSMTNENNTTVEVNGQPETSIYINGSDSNIDIPVTSKINIGLDTSGADGQMDFNITLIDDTLQQSNPLLFSILKDTILPSISTNSTISITEGNTTAVDINATDTNTLTYSLTGTDVDAFDINSTTGLVTFKISPTDYEYPTDQNQDNIYNIIANVSDGINNITKAIDITVIQIVNNVPQLSNFLVNINENITNGTVIGNISFISDDSNITSFNLSGSGAIKFDINTTGYITIANGVTIDYEDIQEYNLTVYATNSAGDSNNTLVNIGINNIIDEVAIVDNFTANIDENTEGGATVGTLNIIQGDSSITLIDLNNTNVSISSEFEIDTSGVIRLKSNISLDYETKSIYNLTAKALNTAGYSNEATVTININDINSPAPVLYDFTTTLNSVHTSGYTVGQINIEQGDGDITSISITGGTHSDNFNISNDGIITLSDDVNLTDTSISNYTFTVKATNNQGNSNEVTITINMTYDVDLYIQSAVYDNNNTTSIDDDNLYIYFNSQIDENSFTASLSDSFAITGTGEIGSGSTKVCDDSLYHLCIINQDSSTGSTEIIPIITQIKIAQNTIKDVNGSNPSSYINTTIEKYKYILKTGQINSYDENGTIDNSVEDDNFYSKGLDRNFTRDDANEIVTDNSLRVDWQDNNDTNAENKTWDDSVSYCDNLILNGDDDWRLPTRKEFFLILNKNNYNPALENVFINHNVSTYWTSTKDANDNTKAWKIYIEYGRNLSKDITTTSNVKCIRN
ncbi:MAG: hypothetical protein DRG78_02995 [Epsilonproteobacteria bacterium]|nr:MAG: hypothetical protein DRG78_02995 [Campylobacterota bacterium]